MEILNRSKNFFLGLLFPNFCLGCREEGDYLCQDCQATLEILEYQYCLCKSPLRLPKAGKCKSCRSKKLNGLYFALNYRSPFAQKLIHQFKYEPLVKELTKPLASLIIAHFQLLANPPDFSNFIIIPIPLEKKRLKWRGFNQAEELAKELSSSLKILLSSDCLIKIKETLPQVDLSAKEREENPKGAFLLKKGDETKGRKVLLVDDVYTTGATMEEAARVLKEAGAKEVWGVVVARG